MEGGGGEQGERPRVGYLGPAGTFTEEALFASAAPDAVAAVALPSIYETILAVQEGRVEWGIVPIENSLDGSVTVTLDLLAEARGPQIVGEALLAVRHSLIAPRRLPLAEVTAVLSHPQVPGQCTRFLRGELAHARVLAASSTAAAVRQVCAGEAPAGTAALGTPLAAEIYGGIVLRENVQDRDDNETRFVWLAPAGDGTGRRAPLREAGGAWKTSLVFWGAGADSPGWLVRCLGEFADRELNLTKIESRPQRAKLGHYMFFADVQGSIEEERVARAVAALRELCEEVRVLGCYRAA